MLLLERRVDCGDPDGLRGRRLFGLFGFLFVDDRSEAGFFPRLELCGLECPASDDSEGDGGNGFGLHFGLRFGLRFGLHFGLDGERSKFFFDDGLYFSLEMGRIHVEYWKGACKRSSRQIITGS